MVSLKFLTYSTQQENANITNFIFDVLSKIQYTTLKYSHLISTVIEANKEGNYIYREHKVDNIVCLWKPDWAQ